MKASDISEAEAREAISSVQKDMAKDGGYWSTIPEKERWANVREIQKKLCNKYPPKVVLAKLKSLLRRKIIHGCLCGCRGDIYFTDAYEDPLA